jgi:hypothetical protein
MDLPCGTVLLKGLAGMGVDFDERLMGKASLL